MRGQIKKGLFMSAVVALLTITGCERQTESYSHTDFAMGTVTNVTLYGTGDLEEKEKNIIEEVKDLEDTISWRIENSQLSKINQELKDNNGKAKATGDMKDWISRALQISRDSYSDGRNTVDPTIGALTQLWDFESDDPKVPSESSIQKALQGNLAVNSSQTTIDEDGTITAENPNTVLDFGAFGKGIGTDVVKEILEKDDEISGAMVALGGSIYVYGEKPDGEDWNVGIQTPSRGSGEILGTIRTKGDTSISTSGDYEKYFTDEATGKTYFHILDSKTGYSVETDITSCTIIADSGLDCDGLSTACFAVGPEKSQELLKKYDAAAIFVDKKNHVYVSGDVDFSLSDENYEEVSLEEFLKANQ